MKLVKVTIMLLAAITISAGAALAEPVSLPSITSGDDRPLRVAVDAQGSLYVTEPAKGRVMKYDSEGTFLTSLNVPYPLGVAVDANGTIYVGSAPSSTRLVSNTVRMYSSSMQDLGCLGGNGTCALFGAPNDIAIDGSGRIYVVDSEPLASAVKVFEPNGSLALTIKGLTAEVLRKPMGIAINDATGEVFITDSPKDMCAGTEKDGMRVTYLC
jgi:DNA-binding beta-propeller fold protein YncE